MVNEKAFLFFLSVAPNLFGGLNPFEKYYSKMGIFPNFRAEH